MTNLSPTVQGVLATIEGNTNTLRLELKLGHLSHNELFELSRQCNAAATRLELIATNAIEAVEADLVNS